MHHHDLEFVATQLRPGSRRRVHLGGWQRQRPDARDEPFRLKLHRGAFDVPPSKPVDLRHGCSAVEDQGELGSCTAHAVVAALEYNENRLLGSCTDVSRLFQYLATRVLQGDVNKDDGATLRAAVKAARRFGAVAEERWPYDAQSFAVLGNEALWAEARRHRVTSYHSIADGDAESIKAALHLGYLVLAGIEVTRAALSQSAARTGILPTPCADERFIGGHAVALVGYDDGAEKFAFRNSWGADWGDGGYGYLGYDYVGDARLAGDFWVIRSAFTP